MILNMLRKPTRYLHLSGDPVGYPKPVTLALRGEFIMAALFVASYGLTHDRVVVAQSLTGGAIGLGITAVWRKRQEDVGKKAFGDCVIDKMPSEQDIIASYKYKQIFQSNASGFRTNSLIDLGFTGIGISFSGIGAHSPVLTTLFSCYTAYHISQAFNFRKLANSQWALADEPPKDKVLDHLKSKAPEIKLAPQAA